MFLLGQVSEVIAIENFVFNIENSFSKKSGKVKFAPAFKTLFPPSKAPAFGVVELVIPGISTPAAIAEEELLKVKSPFATLAKFEFSSERFKYRLFSGLKC